MTYHYLTSEIIKLVAVHYKIISMHLNHEKLSLPDIENLYEKVFSVRSAMKTLFYRPEIFTKYCQEKVDEQRMCMKLHKGFINTDDR